MIDYGAGNGLLGMFAKHCGFKKVYLTDIDKSFTEGATVLARELDIEIDGIVHGDITDVKNIFTGIPDAIIGTDVIEHIYDLDIFFSTMYSFNPGIVSVFTTASNPENYFKIRQLKKLQLKDELEGGDPGDFLLFGEHGHESFLKIRKGIINDTASLTSNEVEQIAKATRGYDKNDIVKAVNKYILTKELPMPPSHPTNTVNPLNSSWTERILSLEEYAAIYARHGFSLEIHTGFYDGFKPG
ncbi:MAG TPA: class I SAM-dependent methyltransferase, partial [Ferruginibacter sp.]|nr:class I SAM-dependent methyltransferase [Ferruginibacter sp.]